MGPLFCSLVITSWRPRPLVPILPGSLLLWAATLDGQKDCLTPPRLPDLKGLGARVNIWMSLPLPAQRWPLLPEPPLPPPKGLDSHWSRHLAHIWLGCPPEEPRRGERQLPAEDRLCCPRLLPVPDVWTLLPPSQRVLPRELLLVRCAWRPTAQLTLPTLPTPYQSHQGA